MIEHVGRPDDIPARYWLAWVVERERAEAQAQADDRQRPRGDSDIEVLDGADT